MTKEQSFKKWFTYVILVLGAGSIYKLPFLKSVFYGQMQEFMGLSHTEIGTLMSINGLITTFGFGAAVYFTDKVSKKKSLPLSLILTGILGLYMAFFFPGYKQLMVIWVLFGFTCDMMYWPVLLKSIKSLGDDSEQGRLFGFLETGRGLVDTIVVSIGLFIFTYFGSTINSFKSSIIYFSVVVIAIGIISYFCLEDDKISTSSSKKNGEKLDYRAALKMPELWMIAFNAFSVYSIYCGLTYFMPFLKDIYKMPLTLVSVYGIINAYGLKMLGGPIGGIMADKKFKSPTKYLKYSFLAIGASLLGFMFLPHESINIYVGIILTLLIGIMIFSQRAIFFAPVGEINLPEEISGSAMAMASFVGYAPGMFLYSIYGGVLDNFPGMTGYKLIFLSMVIFAGIGFTLSSILMKKIQKKKTEDTVIA